MATLTHRRESKTIPTGNTMIIIEIPHQSEAILYSATEEQFRNYAFEADCNGDLCDDPSNEELQEMLFHDLHKGYVFESNKELKEFGNKYNGHQWVKVKVLIDDYLEDA